MTKHKLPWGEAELEITLPSEWRLLGELTPASVPGVPSVEAEAGRALREPWGAAPLASRNLAGKRIVLVVDDISRPTPIHRFLSVVLQDLARAGARPSDLLLVIALGMHRRMTEPELRQKVGAENLAGLRWENHDARRREALEYLGRTAQGTAVFLNRRLVEADLVVSMGVVEPHALAGFGGGLKNIVPGCAGAETIAGAHLCGAAAGHLPMIGSTPEHNPLRRDLEEAARLLGKEIFLVNTVLNPALEIVRIEAGDPILAHRRAVELARRISSVLVPEQADILITNSAPMDMDLRQSLKCVGNTLGAAKPGGTILAFLRCAEGVGAFSLPKRKGLPLPLLKRLVRALGTRRTVRFLERFRKDLGVEEKFLAVYSLQAIQRNDIWAYAPSLTPGEAARAGMFRRFSDPAGMIEQLRRRAPRRPSVILFPRGGVTYPQMPEAEETANPYSWKNGSKLG
ncbi:MAG TPA: nickel-dependent lactate racemase [Candidatus Acidoferrales bacterium]